MPGHWSGARGIVRYASLMSLTAPWEPGGRRHMREEMTGKVPHVQGKLSALIWLLMDEMCVRGVRGWEKFWTSRYLPGCPGLGMMLIGDV